MKTLVMAAMATIITASAVIAGPFHNPLETTKDICEHGGGYLYTELRLEGGQLTASLRPTNTEFRYVPTEQDKANGMLGRETAQHDCKVYVTNIEFATEAFGDLDQANILEEDLRTIHIRQDIDEVNEGFRWSGSEFRSDTQYHVDKFHNVQVQNWNEHL